MCSAYVWGANVGGLHHDTDLVCVCFPCTETRCSRPTVPICTVRRGDVSFSPWVLWCCWAVDGVLLVHHVGGVFPRCTVPPKSSMPGDKETRRFADRGLLFILLLRSSSRMKWSVRQSFAYSPGNLNMHLFGARVS